MVVGLAACSGSSLDLDEPQDADEAESKADMFRQVCSKTVKCGDPQADAILFPGNPACPNGCERGLAGDDVYIPPRNGKPFGDTHSLGALPARVL